MAGNLSFRKAAILIAALDDETAEVLLAEMPAEMAESIDRELDALDEEISAEEQRQVVEEFLRLGTLAPEVDPPGLELSDELAERLTPQPSSYPHNDPSTTAIHSWDAAPHRDPSRVPLNSLQNVDAGALATALEAEPPQIISVVVANLPAHRAGDLLARLPAATQAEVIRRLERLGPTSVEVLAEIEQSIAGRIRHAKPISPPSLGFSTVSTILNSADEAARRQILSNLARHDRPLAGKLKPPATPLPRFTFDDVCLLNTDGLLRVVQAAPLETAVLAFAGADAELVEVLVECLPPAESQRFARGIAELGPTRLADIEAAQNALAELAGQLAADGHLHGGPPIHLTAVA